VSDDTDDSMDFESMKDKVPSFDLPRVNEMPRTDPRYLDYVRDSLFSLDNMIDTWQGYIDDLGERDPDLVVDNLPGHPYMKQGDAVKLFGKQLDLILARNFLFTGEALLFTRVRSLHKNGHPSKISHLFVDMGTGDCMYAKSDSESKDVAYHPDQGGSASDVVGKEWVKGLSPEQAQQPFYLVTCLIDGLDPTELVKKGSMMADAYMAQKFPEFYKKHGFDVPDFKQEGSKLVVETDAELDEITLSLAPLKNMNFELGLPGKRTPYN